MNNAFDDIRAAVSQAKDQLRAADSVANNMAEMLVGRLRCVTWISDLKKLKRELNDFNASTGRWKE